MIEDMTVRSFSEKTQNGYLRHVETLAAFLGRSPDTVTGDDLRQFQLDQVEHGAQASKLNSQASGLRFFFTITLGRPDLTHQLVRTNYPRKLPRILSPDEVLRLLEAAPGPGLKYKAALSIAYGAGLRVGEIVMLRVGDIDSDGAPSVRQFVDRKGAALALEELRGETEAWARVFGSAAREGKIRAHYSPEHRADSDLDFSRLA